MTADELAVSAALADLEALVEAAKGWEAAAPWGKPDRDYALHAALARVLGTVLGTEQDTA